MKLSHLGPRTARSRTMVVASFLAVAGIIAWVALPVPYVIDAPGPLVNTLGEYQGEKVVQILGTTTHPTDGELNITTADRTGGPDGAPPLGEVILALFNEEKDVIPQHEVFPPDLSDEQIKQRSAADIVGAEANAVAAAMGVLGLPVTEEQTIVVAVLTDAPANGVLEADDLVLAVDGVPTPTSADVIAAVRALTVGTEATITVERDGERTDEVVTLGDNPADPSTSALGIVMSPVFDAPFPTEFTLEGIVGPSVGMIFTLSIIDQLTPESLTGGDVIAGTGTVDPQGNVGDIGTIAQKMNAARAGGAQLFLAPRANCDAVRDNVPEGLPVAAVENIDEALAALAAHREGRPVVGCGSV